MRSCATTNLAYSVRINRAIWPFVHHGSLRSFSVTTGNGTSVISGICLGEFRHRTRHVEAEVTTINEQSRVLFRPNAGFQPHCRPC